MHIVPKNSLEQFDFPFIIALLSKKCNGNLGVSAIEQQPFFTKEEELSQHLDCIQEVRQLIENGIQLPQQGFNQLAFLDTIYVSNLLLPIPNFIQLYHCLSTFKQIYKTIKKQATQDFPLLNTAINNIEVPEQIIAKLKTTLLLEEETINEQCSTKLQEIRKDIQKTQLQLLSNFKRIVTHYKQKGYLHETESSVRNNRRVLAVLSEYKRSIKGIYTDESNNGSITFIEPEATVQLHNDLLALHSIEQREIERILLQLVAEIQPYAATIHQIQDFLQQFDVWQAKANFAIQFQCTLPEIRTEKIIYLKNFRNIVLEYHLKKQNKTIIQNTINLNQENRILVISGPNAGGKSVVLKSVALIQLLFQFGLHIPADEGSMLSVFNAIFSDIGDEQSLENDVSTYSAHLQKMKYFIENANGSTLVLLDELGDGTDPTLGGAIAEAILETLHQQNVMAVVTTHFNNIKVIAAQTKEMLSAGMAFNKKNLQPLYELQLGQPGSSFTFEIAQKIGIPSHIIALAQTKTSSNQRALDDTLNEVQIEKQIIKGLRKNVQQREHQLNDIVENYEQLKRDLEKSKKRLLKNYEQKLLDFYNEKSSLLEQEMRVWKELKNKEQYQKLRIKIDENRLHIEQNLTKLEQNLISNTTPITIGNTVCLDDGDEQGTVIAIHGNKATVVFGNLHTKVALNKLSPVQQETNLTYKVQSKSKQIIEKAQFELQLDLRGMRIEDAHFALEHYLDKAIVNNSNKFNILHGRGTGALRQYVWNYLKTYPYIKNYYFEKEQFGGNGITIVELK